MRRVGVWLTAGLVLLGATALVACTEEDADRAQDQVQGAANTVTKEMKDAWVSASVDGEKLIDDVQTRNDPEAKRKLLENCRKGEEQMRKANADAGRQMQQLCDQIRDADVNNRGAWDGVRTRWNELKTRYGV